LDHIHSGDVGIGLEEVDGETPAKVRSEEDAEGCAFVVGAVIVASEKEGEDE
jgi:hypothetical protein